MITSYPAEFKAQVISEFKAGSSLNQLAAAHHCPKSTIQGWVRQHERVRVVPKKENPLAAYDLDDMAVKLVDGSVSAVQAIFGVTKDDTWLKRQNAADLAVLAGVISDKLYRLLGAIGPANNPDNGAHSLDSGATTPVDR